MCKQVCVGVRFDRGYKTDGDMLSLLVAKDERDISYVTLRAGEKFTLQ